MSRNRRIGTGVRRATSRAGIRGLAAAVVLGALPWSAATASNPESWSQLDREAATACAAAAGLKDPKVSPAVRFSDEHAVEVRLVTGTWPQAHMAGRKATQLCLYDRRAKRAEIQEAEGWRAPSLAQLPRAASGPTGGAATAAPAVRGVAWRAVRIGGTPVQAGTTVTLTFDSGGRVAGNSGCNGYSARYVLDGAKLQVIPPVIGTRKACAPAVMEQERRYTDLLVAATSLRTGERGALVMSTNDGRTLEFERAAGGAQAGDPSFPQYRCGDERVKLKLDETQAFAEFDDGVGITLQRLQPDAANGVRTYTNGRLTIAYSPEGAEPRIRMARGRMALLPCTRIEE